ncbi:MAG: hypothetical protein Q8O41_00455 [Candidatus Methanoperedens sp.]|nr:hypothetical protein [Candidatus Methanoperedens sp.]
MCALIVFAAPPSCLVSGIEGGKGSHVIYRREGMREMLNFQNVGGWAKPYQVRQLLKIIDKYNLLKEVSDV